MWNSIFCVLHEITAIVIENETVFVEPDAWDMKNTYKILVGN